MLPLIAPDRRSAPTSNPWLYYHRRVVEKESGGGEGGSKLSKRLDNLTKQVARNMEVSKEYVETSMDKVDEELDKQDLKISQMATKRDIADLKVALARLEERVRTA